MSYNVGNNAFKTVFGDGEATYVEKTGNYTMVANDKVFVTATAIMTLPASPVKGNSVQIRRATTGKVQIDVNGSKINSNGLVGYAIIPTNGLTVTLMYIDTTIGWVDVFGVLGYVPSTNIYTCLSSLSDVTDDGTGLCSAWGDQSTNNKDASQSTQANRPAIETDAQSIPYLYFDGYNSKIMQIGANADLNSQANLSIALCLNIVNETEENYIMCKSNGATDDTIWLEAYLNFIRLIGTNGYTQQEQSGHDKLGTYGFQEIIGQKTDWHIAVNWASGGGRSDLLRKGVYNGNVANTLTAPVLNNSLLMLGQRYTGENGYFKLYSLIMWTKKLTMVEQIAVSKWMQSNFVY